MAGIFPREGVPPGSATNAVDADTTCSEDELFYEQGRCPSRMDPQAMNALISEVLNVMTAAGFQYDCERLDNLSRAISDMIVAGGGTGTTVSAATATEAGTDDFGREYAIGDILVSGMIGGRLAVHSYPAAATVNSLGLTRVATTAQVESMESFSGSDPLSMSPGAMRIIPDLVGPVADDDKVWLHDQSADKMQQVSVSNLRSPNASASVKGVVEVATAAEVQSAIAAGSTGARVVISPDQLAAAADFAGVFDSSNARVWFKDTASGEMNWLPASELTNAAATATSAGSVEMATTVEVATGASAGTSGAPLAMAPNTMGAVSDFASAPAEADARFWVKDNTDGSMKWMTGAQVRSMLGL